MKKKVEKNLKIFLILKKKKKEKESKKENFFNRIGENTINYINILPKRCVVRVNFIKKFFLDEKSKVVSEFLNITLGYIGKILNKKIKK